MNFILRDHTDSGKSTFVLEMTKRLLSAGFSISGWITSPHLESGKKIGHDFLAIDRGRFSDPIPFTRPLPFENSFRWKRFHFNTCAFERAKALDTRCDLFIMDEIGPLEIDEGRGFSWALDDKSREATLIVCRIGIEEGIMRELGVGDGKPSIHDLASGSALEKAIFKRIDALRR